jgi:hypothetical protein
MNLNLYSAEEMKKMLKDSGFSDIVIDYYKGLWVPFKGYIVPKGMIAKGIKKTDGETLDKFQKDGLIQSSQ